MTPEELCENLESMGLEPRSYSGRGMFGRECVAVVVTHPGGHELPKGWVWDSMGRDVVVYWPRKAWPFPDDEEEAA